MRKDKDKHSRPARSTRTGKEVGGAEQGTRQKEIHDTRVLKSLLRWVSL